jgi:hypothetical protein
MGRHPCHPDTMTCGHQISASAAIPLPIVACFSSSQPLSSCPRCELAGLEQPLWLGQYLWPASADRFYHGSLGQRHCVWQSA